MKINTKVSALTHCMSIKRNKEIPILIEYYVICAMIIVWMVPLGIY